jgi:glycosyltransferase involved in cell wall biosynthesis
MMLTTFKKIWLGGMAARLARVPLVVVRIGIGGMRARNATYTWPLERWIDAVVMNNEALCAPFVAGLPDGGRVRVTAIRDGVSARPSARSRDVVRAELSLSPEAVVVGCIARLAPQKRVDRLVGALALLPDYVHAVVAGEGPERDALAALAASLGVAHRLHLLGYRDDVGDLLGAFDVFAITSDFEGLANAMLEAMVAGLPVVSTPVDGAHDALSGADGEAAPGVVSDFTPSGVASALRPLCDSVALRTSMGHAARHRAGERYGFERMVDEWEALLSARR